MNVFLCYSSKDSLPARKLYDRLSIYIKYKTWFDFGTYQNVEEVIENSNIVIILLSQQSISQKGYEEEFFIRTLNRVNELKAQGKRRLLVVPIRLDECTIPDHLQYLPWKDYYSKNAFEDLINSFWIYQFEFNSPAIYATAGRAASKDPMKFPVEGPAELYEKINWHKYIEIPASSKTNYSFLIRKHCVSNAHYLRFLKSDDYADKRYWVNFPKYDENCNYIGDWGNTGLEWLEKVLKHYPSLLEKFLDIKWHFPNTGTSYDFRQPNHPVVKITWIEANAYCKWLSLHWQETPDAESLSSITSYKKINFRLPLEAEIHAALNSNNNTSIKIDPTGRQYDRYPELSIDISEKDMLANLYDSTQKDSLAYCYGRMFIDEHAKEMSRLSDRGSLGLTADYDEYAFRVVVTESKIVQ